MRGEYALLELDKVCRSSLDINFLDGTTKPHLDLDIRFGLGHAMMIWKTLLHLFIMDTISVTAMSTSRYSYI